jgi:hypothetical protein
MKLASPDGKRNEMPSVRLEGLTMNAAGSSPGRRGGSLNLEETTKP